MRQAVNLQTPFETAIGFSRCVRIGEVAAISGTAPIGAEEAYGQDDALFVQTQRCLEIIRQTLQELDCGEADIIRTRVFLTEMSRWKQAARAHREFFNDPGPACTFVGVSHFIDQRWLVEIEADAVCKA